MMEHSQETREMLYWHSNESWYVFDPSVKHQYRLTEAAPPRARASFTAWVKAREEQ